MPLCYYINFSPSNFFSFCCLFFLPLAKCFSVLLKIGYWKSFFFLDGYIMLFECVYYVYCFIHDHGWMNQRKKINTDSICWINVECKKHLVSIVRFCGTVWQNVRFRWRKNGQIIDEADKGVLLYVHPWF